MTKVYHGTHLSNGLAIARAGAILSPYKQFLRNVMENNYPTSPEGLKELFPDKTFEKIILDFASSGYSEDEIEHRVKCFSVTTDFDNASSYGTRFEDYKGGIILGLEIDEKVIRNLSGHYLNNKIYFIPGKLSLDNLKEVHISQKATTNFDDIRREFDKYSPDYFFLKK